MAFKLLALSVLFATLAIGASGEGLFGLGIIGKLLGSGLGEGLLGDNIGLVGGLLGQNGLVGGLLKPSGLIGALLGTVNRLLGLPIGLLNIAGIDGLLMNLLKGNGLPSVLGETGLVGILTDIIKLVVALLTTIRELLSSNMAANAPVAQILSEVQKLLQEALAEFANVLLQLVQIVPGLLSGLTGASGAPSVASTGAF